MVIALMSALFLNKITVAPERKEITKNSISMFAVLFILQHG